MRIAIDARPLSHLSNGIGRYTHEMSHSIIQLSPPDCTWYLYSIKNIKQPGLSRNNVRVRSLGIDLKFFNSIAAQLIFPIWSFVDRVDTFWSPRHHLPLFLQKRINKILTIHDLVWLRHPGTMKYSGWLLESFLMPKSLKKADKIITVSDFTKSELIKNFSLKKENIQTIYSAPAHIFIDKAKEIARSEKAINNYYLFVGTLEPRKNLVRLVIAYKRALETGLNKRLLLVGKPGWGNTYRKIQYLIKELELTNNVEIIENVTDSQLARLYYNSYALLLPSLYEGFGLPVIESLYFGKPVITSNNSAVVEITKFGAIHVDPLSITELTSAMKLLEDQKDIYMSLANTGKKYSSEFSWDDSAIKFLNILTKQVKFNG